MRNSWTLWRSYRRNRMLWVCLHTDYLTLLDKPDMIDSVTAVNVLCVYVCLYYSSVTQRERETDSCYWDQPANHHGTSSHAQVSASVSVCGHVFVCVYVGTRYAVPQLNPSNPSTSSLHAGMMLTVPAFLWIMFLPSTDITLDRCVAVSNVLCPRFTLNTN